MKRLSAIQEQDGQIAHRRILQDPATRKNVRKFGIRHAYHARTAVLRRSNQRTHIVSSHNDFQILPVVRPNAQNRQLKYLPKRHVAEREEHETKS